MHTNSVHNGTENTKLITYNIKPVTKKTKLITKNTKLITTVSQVKLVTIALRARRQKSATRRRPAGGILWGSQRG